MSMLLDRITAMSSLLRSFERSRVLSKGVGRVSLCYFKASRTSASTVESSVVW
jgi:hypothetical protein